MKKKVFIYLIIGAIILACHPKEKLEVNEKSSKIPIIFDTDFGPDYDDVGAITLLHCFADSGYIDILATVGSNTDEKVAPAIDVLNTYFGRTDIPIGVPKGTAGYKVCEQHWNDSIIQHYPHDITSNSAAPDAVKIYRKALAESEDHSVVIVTVGFLSNLSDLLQSKPDEISDLNGVQLVKKKVKELVSMAGKFPEGREFNVFVDSTKAQYAIDNWPTQIIFSGFEIGSAIRTGLPLINNDNIQNSPVKDVFHQCITSDHWKGDINGRMSWDQTAVLVAVKGISPYFGSVKGKFITKSNGSNKWQDNPEGTHSYLNFKMTADEIKEIIDTYMMHEPVIRSKH